MWKISILPDRLLLPHCHIHSDETCIDYRCLQMIENWCYGSFEYNRKGGRILGNRIDVTIKDIDSKCVCGKKMLVFSTYHEAWSRHDLILACRCGYWINSNIYKSRHGVIVPDDLSESDHIIKDYSRGSGILQP